MYCIRISYTDGTTATQFIATDIPICPAETDFTYVNYFDRTQSAGLAVYCKDTAFLTDEYDIDCTAYAERLGYYQNLGACYESYVIADITLPEAYQGRQENVYFIAIPEEALAKLITDDHWHCKNGRFACGRRL